VLVFRKLAGVVDVLLDIGGSEETKAILPKMGFQHAADMEMFARVVRPWGQFRPGAAVSGFQVKQDGRSRGHFLLSRCGGQTRIADIGLDSDDPEDWRAAFVLAARAVSSDPATCEIVAAATVPLLGEAIRRAGFRSRWKEPLLPILAIASVVVPRSTIRRRCCSGWRNTERIRGCCWGKGC
jgi:hypothetical protein